MANQPKGYTTGISQTGPNPGKVVTGGRALVKVNGNLVGIFESASVSRGLGTEPIYILGNYAPVEISIVDAQPVSVSCSGFRVAGAGVNTLPAFPLVQDLLLFDPFTITIIDRQSGDVLETIINCVPGTNSVNYNARATSKVQIQYTGTIGYNEDQTTADSDGGGNNLP